MMLHNNQCHHPHLNLIKRNPVPLHFLEILPLHYLTFPSNDFFLSSFYAPSLIMSSQPKSERIGGHKKQPQTTTLASQKSQQRGKILVSRSGARPGSNRSKGGKRENHDSRRHLLLGLALQRSRGIVFQVLFVSMIDLVLGLFISW